MLFNSLTFVVFFAVVVTAYWSVRSWNVRENLLVVASYIFYGAWNPPFAALLFSTTAMDFWLGSRIARAKGASFATHVVGRQRLHESEHAWVFQIRKFPAPKFSVATRAHRHHLSTAAHGHSSARRDFLLHFPFSLLHARHLSRSTAAHQIAARFHPCRFLFSSAGRGTDRARRGFSSTTCHAAGFAHGPISLGTIAHDAGPV